MSHESPEGGALHRLEMKLQPWGELTSTIKCNAPLQHQEGGVHQGSPSTQCWKV